jgi:DNA-binding beta-propeller fold protein YncE
VNRRRFLLTLAALPILVRDDPAALARRLGGTPLALVTADTQSHVVAVYLTGAVGAVYRRIRTLPGPRSIQAIANTAVIAHTQQGAVSLLDGGPLTVRTVLRDFDEPRYTAPSTDGRYAYVSDSGRGEIVVLDVRAGKIVARTSVPGPARHLTVAQASRTLWVSLGSKASEIAILDIAEPPRPRLVRTIAPPFLAHDVGFQPASTRVWVTSGAEHRLAVYDARTHRLLRLHPADAPPQHVTFTHGAAFVTSGDDGMLRVRSLSSGRVIRSTPVPFGSYNVQEAWGGVLAPSLDRGTLCIIDRHGRVRERERVASSSHDACFIMAA